MYDLLIKNCQLDGVAADIAIKNGKISAIGKITAEAAETFDASNLAALPPFYNTHTHAAMTLLRSYAEDCFSLHDGVMESEYIFTHLQ